MKRPGLSPALFAATLFLVASVSAQPPGEPRRDTKRDGAPNAMAMTNRSAELLKRFDKNGDGKLDEVELADGREAMFQEQMAKQAAVAASPRAPELQARILELFDRNADGRLDDAERGEMQRFFENAQPGAMRENLLRVFDRNADGKIDVPEMAELEKFMRPRIESTTAQLQRFDRNADGKLDDAEWAAARAQLERMFAAPPAPAAPAPTGVRAEREKLEAIAAEVAQRRAEREERAKRAQETAAPKP